MRLPSWLHLGIEHRNRFEHLQRDFRVTGRGPATLIALRTLAIAELRLSPIVVVAEVQDSRAPASATTSLSSSLVDPIDLLQGYVGLRDESTDTTAGATTLKLGRFTLDFASRRLVTRNAFRNTINAFSGIDVARVTPTGHRLRAFTVVPVTREPSAPDDLVDHRVARDHENLDVLLWGAGYGAPRLTTAALDVEGYVIGLHERDGPAYSSANRQLVTHGVRVVRAPAPGRFDLQIEGMVQLGQSRTSVARTDIDDRVHAAWSTHVSVGYQFDARWTPRPVLVHDFASGDRSPADDRNGRFDPLFGGRRSEFGPTSVMGTVARSNLDSPGFRLELGPHRRVDAFVAYRLFWLAAARDAWTTAGLRDDSGHSGRFVGQQAEGRVRWQALPENLALECGAAWLVRGAFARDAPGADDAPTAFVYTQLTVSL